TPRGVRSLKIVQYTRGCLGLACYKVSFSLVQIDLSTLVLESPVCTPMAIIIGDDDGFSGVQFARPGLVGPKIRVQSKCDDVNNWPGRRARPAAPRRGFPLTARWAHE